MTSADRNDLMPAPAQEKLEWVTPKISLMDAGATDTKPTPQVKRLLLFHMERSLLTDYISNPSTPTKTNNTKGSLKTLF